MKWMAEIFVRKKELHVDLTARSVKHPNGTRISWDACPGGYIQAVREFQEDIPEFRGLKLSEAAAEITEGGCTQAPSCYVFRHYLDNVNSTDWSPCVVLMLDTESDPPDDFKAKRWKVKSGNPDILKS